MDKFICISNRVFWQLFDSSYCQPMSLSREFSISCCTLKVSGDVMGLSRVYLNKEYRGVNIREVYDCYGNLVKELNEPLNKISIYNICRHHVACPTSKAPFSTAYLSGDNGTWCIKISLNSDNIPKSLVSPSAVKIPASVLSKINLSEDRLIDIHNELVLYKDNSRLSDVLGTMSNVDGIVPRYISIIAPLGIMSIGLNKDNVVRTNNGYNFVVTLDDEMTGIEAQNDPAFANESLTVSDIEELSNKYKE